MLRLTLYQRPALISPLTGWKAYPLRLRGRLEGQGFHVELRLEIGYSSTCPSSAALAMQLINGNSAEILQTKASIMLLSNNL